MATSALTTFVLLTAGLSLSLPGTDAIAQQLPAPSERKVIASDQHATVGSDRPTPAVGVDIGYGMIACKTTLTAEDLPDNLGPLR